MTTDRPLKPQHKGDFPAYRFIPSLQVWVKSNHPKLGMIPSYIEAMLTGEYWGLRKISLEHMSPEMLEALFTAIGGKQFLFLSRPTLVALLFEFFTAVGEIQIEDYKGVLEWFHSERKKYLSEIRINRSKYLLATDLVSLSKKVYGNNEIGYLHFPIEIAVETGLPLEMICKLRWKDIDLANQRINVPFKHHRVAIPFTPFLSIKLKLLRNGIPQKFNGLVPRMPLIIKENGDPVDYRLDKVWETVSTLLSEIKPSKPSTSIFGVTKYLNSEDDITTRRYILDGRLLTNGVKHDLDMLEALYGQEPMDSWGLAYIKLFV